MKKATLASLIVCSTGLLAGPVSHAEGFYFALQGGVSSFDTQSRSSQDDDLVAAFDDIAVDVEDFDSSLDDTGKVWGLEVGYQWNSYIGVEVGYLDLGKTVYRADFTADGEASKAKARISSKGATVNVIGFLPLGERFDLHARGGVFFSNTRNRAAITFLEQEVRGQNEGTDKEADMFAGLGATFNFNDSYGVRADYRRFFDVGGKKTGEGDVDVLTLSVLFR